MPESELQTAINAALAAGKLIRERFRVHSHIHWKSPANPVTETDLMSEKIIRELLLCRYPSYGFLGEESESTVRDNHPFWIIDPLDGTVNFAHGYPHFAISIALQKDGLVTAGVVYQPLTEELFTAELGKGAQLNGKTIKASIIENVSNALVASGFPYDSWVNSNNNSFEWVNMVKKALSMRCDGAAALNLSYIASGRLDAYWELDLEPWDMAAGSLICTEAGGKVTCVNGDPFSAIGSRSIVATNGFIHDEILAVLQNN